MDLIYADVEKGIIIDRGVLNTYTFDCSFGEKENDFELRVPMGAHELSEDQIVYVNGTEYGGVIDAIEVDTENQMMIYTGRTWHGILENKILYPQPGYNYFYVNGDANEVLRELLERMNIIPGDLNELYVKPENAFMSVATHNAGYDVNARVASESGNYAHGYTFIRDLLYQFDLKPKIVNGVIEAVPNVDYSSDDDFLEGTDQFRAKRNYNSINRLHCMGSGNLADRYVIDLYLDENGGLLPYARENPVQDSDYYTDIAALAESTNEEDIKNFEILSAHMVTGINEMADIYDYPSIGSTYHYVLLETVPDDWGKDLTPSKELDEKEWGFEQYFSQTLKNDTVEYKNLEKPALAYRYDLQLSMPGDWTSNFANYYVSDNEGYKSVDPVELYDVQSTQPPQWDAGAYMNYYKLENGSYVTISQVPGLIRLTTQPPDWTTRWTEYCKQDGSKVESIVPEPTYELLKKKPSDWDKYYSNYYQTDGVDFSTVSPKSVKDYVLTTYQPSNWKKEYKNYFRRQRKNFYQVTDKTAPKWKANTFYKEVTKNETPSFRKNKYYVKHQDDPHAPNFVPGAYYSSGYVIPAFSAQTVYKKRTYPTWQTNTYYTAVQYQPIPEFIAGAYFKQYEDHFEALIEAAKKKLEEYMKKDELEITLDEKRVYDINDRIGASDEVTGIGASERITQKIIKIERGIVTYKYNTGK